MQSEIYKSSSTSACQELKLTSSRFSLILSFISFKEIPTFFYIYPLKS